MNCTVLIKKPRVKCISQKRQGLIDKCEGH